MNHEIMKLEPQIVWKHFYNISQIPRKPGNEKKVREFIKKFAIGLGLETDVDRVGNLLVRKPAAAGITNRRTICLQGHMDMVAQKSNDVIHDFDEDPLKLYIDGDWVTADGTTLGADDGIGVAAMMAVLESKNISHGPIEALFTAGEESGFTGAFGLKPGVLQSDILINLDSEFEGQLCIGSAGGRITTASFHYTEEPTLPNSAAYEIRLTGLRGGHSGVDIHMEWGNANKILNRFICHAVQSCRVRIASIDGGSVISAIPSEAFAVVVVPGEKLTIFTKNVKEFEESVKAELSPSEPDVSFEAVAVEMPGTVIDKITIGNLIRAICDCPHGVIRMSDEVEALVHTSTNLGLIRSGDGKINVTTLQRSFDENSIKELGKRINRTFKWVGASGVKYGAMLPGWAPDMNSTVLKEMRVIYKNLFNREATVKMIHAGLECGVIKKVYPDMEMISMGPTICFAHTPGESVDIGTVKDFWSFLVETLKNIGEKR